MASSVLGVTRGSRVPVVVVLGATGTGKSKLAIEIANKFNGEIISADSMQVYRGLDIITNKVTSEEQKCAPHHMLDFLDPLSRYSVMDFRNAALPLMERLLSQDTMPVIVGGTNYYIESLLWNVLVDSGPSEDLSQAKLVFERDKEHYGIPEKKNDGANSDESVQKKLKINSDTGGGKSEKSEISNAGGGGGDVGAESVDNNNVIGCPSDSEGDVISDHAKESEVKENVESDKMVNKSKCIAWQDCDIPTEDLYQRLLEVDPKSALQYHPNNRRKIIRSLQVWEQTGRRHSDVLTEQQQQVGGSPLGGALRYKNTAIIWITCQKDVLDVRLDERVDDMIKKGLLQELSDFHTTYNTARLKDGQEPDYTKGIFQSIGFKEFHQYLIMPEEEKMTEKGRNLFETGVENLKQVTRKYARRQVRWIRNRFILPSKRQVPPVYTVDGTDPSRWDVKISEPALSIVQALIDGEKPSYEAVKFSRNAEPELADIDTNDKTRFECDVCGRIVIGKLQWLCHLKGAKHRKMLKRKHQMNNAS